jgi:hypothetical protein
MPDAAPVHNDGVAVERRDVPLWLVASLAAGVVVFFALSSLAIMFVYPSALHGASDAPRGASADPRLQINPPADLAAHRAAEERALTSYGWVDRQHGIVRIPIEQAMHDIAASGIKDWPGDAK